MGRINSNLPRGVVATRRPFRPHFAQLCVIMFSTVNASYKMSLECFSLNGIVDVFPQTSQISNGELRLSFSANNLYGELGITEI